MGQINDQIHFFFPTHHTTEGSFFDRFLNLGTVFLAIPFYTGGFYMLLERILPWFQ